MVRSWGLQFWCFLEGDQGSKVQKIQNCTDLCPQSGYGQVMGSAVLVLFRGGPRFQSAKDPKLHRPMSPEWLWSGHGVCSFGSLELWCFLGVTKVPKCKRPKTAQTYVTRVAMVRSWGLQFWNFGTLVLFRGGPRFQSAKDPKLHRPMSPERLWSGHGVCSFGTLELWCFLEGDQGSKVQKIQNCTDLCPQSGYGQVMGPAVLELWCVLEGDQGSKVQKIQNCTDLCPESGYGQVMGSAVLELWCFLGVTKVPKCKRPKTAQTYVPRVAMVRSWGLQFWCVLEGDKVPKCKRSKTAQTYVPRVAMVRSWGLQFWNFGTLVLFRGGPRFQSAKDQKLHRPMSPEWLWSGHGVCIFGSCVLWRGGQS